MRITFTGDILCYQSQDSHCRKADGSYDYAPIFEGVKPILHEADYVVGSFETTCAGAKAGYTRAATSFNTPDEFLPALKEAGFDLLTTANNHCLDRGEVGLLRTVSKIREAGMEQTGTRLSADEPTFIVKDFDGTKVAFVAYTYGTNSLSNGHLLAKDKAWMVNLTRPQDVPVKRPLWKRIILALLPSALRPRRKAGIVQDCVAEREVTSGRNTEYEAAMVEVIRQARKEADIVIFCLHAGGQFNSKVGTYTQHLFDVISDAGADVIVCNHAHTILPVYKRGKCLIASALGNFSFTPGEGYWVDGVDADYSLVLHLDVDNKVIKDYQFSICRSVINGNGLGISTIANSNTVKYQMITKMICCDE